MQMANRQKGMTGIGWLTVLGLIAFFALLTLRMLPSYLEYYKVASALEQLVGETGLAEVTPSSIRRSLERQFDIGYVSVITPREIRVMPAATRSSRRPRSFSETRDTACPSSPARPVRPMRCT